MASLIIRFSLEKFLLEVNVLLELTLQMVIKYREESCLLRHCYFCYFADAHCLSTTVSLLKCTRWCIKAPLFEWCLLFSVCFGCTASQEMVILLNQ